MLLLCFTFIVVLFLIYIVSVSMAFIFLLLSTLCSMVCLEMCYINTFDLDLDLPITVMFEMSFNPCVSKGNLLACYKFGISGFRV